MQQLTPEGRRIVDDVAQRHGFSSDAVLAMLLAVSTGYGNQAQFNHNEFGGLGQWSSGGMTMIGDMFNNQLKGRVDSLCQELANVIRGQPLFAVPAQSQSQSQGGGWQGQTGGGQQQSSGGFGGSSLFLPGGPSGNWWPAELGMASSTGAQNNLRYAYFPAIRRLAIDVNGQVTVYDTGEHQIGGFGQQQGGDQSLTFTSQFGLVRVADLPRVTSGAPFSTLAAPVAPPPVDSMSAPSGQQPAYQPPPPQAQPQAYTATLPQQSPAGSRAAGGTSSDEIIGLIEKLAELHKKGVLSDSEFETKKADLLGRL